MTESNRFSRPHIDAPEVNLSLFGHDVLDQVKIAYRNSAGSDDQISVNRLAEFLAQAFYRVARYAQALWFRACTAHCCFQQVAVAVADLPRPQRLVHLDHLVACPQYCYPGAAYYRYLCPPQRGQHANFPGTNFCPARENRLSTVHIFSRGANVV